MVLQRYCEKTRYKRNPVNEFELISRFFDRPVRASGLVVGIGDDGAVLKVAPGNDQLQVIDTLVEGVHFPAKAKASDVAYRLVAVNLSDIAAMGGRPRWMTLALTLPQKSEQWLGDFATGLFQAADEHDVALIGGDTTRGDSVVATLHISGEVEEGTALLRSGAQPGDAIFVTGTLGDAAAGLELLRRGEHDDFLVERYWRPSARIETGLSLVGCASSAIDVSDGLVGDLNKLLEASGVGGELDTDKVPLSDAMKSRWDQSARTRFALTGGDDYELCFTARPGDVEHVADATQIGRVTRGESLVCLDAGVVVECDDSGYQHFQ